jgi:hypothetical protein
VIYWFSKILEFASVNQVITLVAPAVSNNFAVSLAPIGTLGLSFLSCLAHQNKEYCCNVCLAEARLAASIISNNSIKLNLGM